MSALCLTFARSKVKVMCDSTNFLSDWYLRTGCGTHGHREAEQEGRYDIAQTLRRSAQITQEGSNLRWDTFNVKSSSNVGPQVVR